MRDSFLGPLARPSSKKKTHLWWYLSLNSSSPLHKFIPKAPGTRSPQELPVGNRKKCVARTRLGSVTREKKILNLDSSWPWPYGVKTWYLHLPLLSTLPWLSGMLSFLQSDLIHLVNHHCLHSSEGSSLSSCNRSKQSNS